MKLLTKYTVIALLSAGLMLATPVRSHAFLGALVDVFNGVKKGIEYAAKITKWTQLSAEVFSYPSPTCRGASQWAMTCPMRNAWRQRPACLSMT